MKQTPAGTADDPRASVRRSRARQFAVLFGFLAFLAALISVASGGFLLYVVWVVLGLGAVAWASAAVALLGVEVRREIDAEEIEYGGVAEGRLILHNKKSLPAWWLFWSERVESGLDVEGASCAFRTLHAGEISQLEYRLHSTRRGLFRVGPAVLEASGPFGLSRRFQVDSSASFVTVLPRRTIMAGAWPTGHRPVHEVPKRHSLFEDPTRFLGIRQYRRGDSLRRIHWRATARSGELQVKVFEPSVLEGLLIAVEMEEQAWPRTLSDPDVLDRDLELAITTAAALAELVLAGGQRVGLISNGADASERYAADWTGGSFRRLDEALEDDGRRSVEEHAPVEIEPGKGGPHLRRLRTALARLVPAPGPTLPRMLDREIPRLPRSLVLMVVTSRVDSELAGALESLRRSGIESAVVRVGRDRSETSALSGNIPVHHVAREQDLALLANAKL